MLLCYGIMKAGSDADDEAEQIYRNLTTKQDRDNV